MRYILENEKLKVFIESVGAEIKSVVNKETDMEYMWYAKPEYWGRTSPILFPFVGAVVDKKYRFEGKEYTMESHGFARDLEFEVDQLSQEEIWFELKNSESTYANYPFCFTLRIGYILCKNNLKVKWEVYNPGQNREDNNLYFSIGAHPAFNCPIGGEDSKEGYRLFFGDAAEIHHHGNLNGTCTHEDILLKLENNRAVITKDFFDRSTYIIENKQLSTVAIETPDGKAYVTVKFDTPLVGIWSPVHGKNAPFICIEPWWGRADYDDFTGELQEREHGNVLEQNETFKNEYEIIFE